MGEIRELIGEALVETALIWYLVEYSGSLSCLFPGIPDARTPPRRVRFCCRWLGGRSAVRCPRRLRHHLRRPAQIAPRRTSMPTALLIPTTLPISSGPFSQAIRCFRAISTAAVMSIPTTSLTMLVRTLRAEPATRTPSPRVTPPKSHPSAAPLLSAALGHPHPPPPSPSFPPSRSNNQSHPAPPSRPSNPHRRRPVPR